MKTNDRYLNEGDAELRASKQALHRNLESTGNHEHQSEAKPRHRQRKQYQRLNNFMPVQFGKLRAQVFGGPFPDYVPGQRRLVSVKMAEEIEHPHDISIPTRDFSVPAVSDMHHGIQKALVALVRGNDLYVGCKGGSGRTGLFMACLAKVMFDYWERIPGTKTQEFGHDPVRYVRSTYYEHAVETEGQQKFVNEFDTLEHVEFMLDELHPLPVVKEVVVTKTVEKPVYIFNPFLAIMNFWTKRGK